MKKTKIVSYLFLTMAFTSLIFLGACKKDKKAETKNVEVRMTDTPASFASLDVEVKSVEIFVEGSGWSTLSTETKSFNVLSLCNGKYISLGNSTEFESGNYTKVKVVFGEKFELKTYAETDLGLINFNATSNAKATWEGPKSIEIDLAAEVQAESNVVFMLDFDVAKSVVKQTAGYTVKPVIKCMKNTETGIQGKLNGAATAYITLDGNGFTASSNMDADGQFKIVGATEGSYSLHIEYYTAGQSANDKPKKKTIENVVIVKGEIKQQGEIQCE